MYRLEITVPVGWSLNTNNKPTRSSRVTVVSLAVTFSLGYLLPVYMPAC